MSEHLTRKFKIESIRAADKKNAFWGTLSTEYSVARGYGNEILLHDSKSIDLSRAPLPLVISHNTNELNIGVVEKLEIVGRKLKGLIRLGNSPKALEIIDDIRGGILTNLSIGYHILDSYLDGDDLIATLWAPHEVSLVSVGADPDSGIGRSLNNFNGEKTMSNKTNEPGTEPSERLSRNQRAQARDATEKERERIAEIDSLAGYFTREIPKNSESAIRSMDEKRKEFIKKGYSIDDFRTWGRDFIDIHGRKSASVPSADDMYQRGVYSGEGGYGGDDDFSRFSVC